MIITHYSGLKPTQLEINVGDCWNSNYKLKDVVTKYGEKQRVVQLWKKFHCAYGYGNKIPNYVLYGIKVDTNSGKHSDDWLAHYGYPLKEK